LSINDVIYTKDIPEELTSERCFIKELLNARQSPELSIAQARVEPGVTTRWHTLSGIEERYYILSGEGSVEVGERKAQPVSPGCLVNIPANTRQRITNTGKDDLLFLAICTPRFEQASYTDLDE
jgi:mannose-6-phosphate isomerase-like protein (cupin superfamily)